MNEEKIRQMIRKEIEMVINEGSSTDLVNYDTFKREFAKALKKVGALDELVKAAYEDANNIVEKFYDEMKSELNALLPDEEQSEMPMIVGFGCIDIVLRLTDGLPNVDNPQEIGEKVADIMTAGSFDSAANDAAWRGPHG